MDASWNAATPPGTWIEVRARAQEDAGWTRWYSLGVWASDTSSVQRHSVGGQADSQGSVDTDTLMLRRPATAYQLRAELHPAASGALPTVSALAASTFPQPIAAGDRSVWGTSLPVPARSQMLPAYHGLGFGGGGEVWCSATSTSMLMVYWADVLGRPELRQPVPTVAAGVYDYAYQGTGNWPFNVA